MNFPIYRDKICEIFPAFIILDAFGYVLDFGPAISRHVPTVKVGDPLSSHFAGGAMTLPTNWDELARERGRVLELRAIENGLVLTGPVISDDSRYLLALNPAAASLNMGTATRAATGFSLHISDFTPGDPAVDVLLLAKMQQAMLDEARTLATHLANERQRHEGLVSRVSRLAGFLAHDFNNTLSIIRLNAERLALLETIGTEGRRLTSIIAETAARGSDITRSFMTLSRRSTEKPAPLLADALIGQHLRFFSSIAGQNVVFTASLRAPRAAVLVSSGEMLNCLTNLVLNSRDAITSSGTIEIATDLAPGVTGGADRLQISVSDTGSGMTSDILQRAFEPFFSTKKQGNGLGLAAVADYLKDCGGNVHLESTPGVGTKVTLDFPTVPLESSPTAANWPHRSIKAETDLRKYPDETPIVLLVEDEPYALEALVEMLEAEGFEVWPASNAEDALARLDAEQSISRAPSVLLTDVILPGMTGIELARATSAKSPRSRIVLMSGFVPTEDHTIDDDWLFAPKPLNLKKLLEILKS